MEKRPALIGGLHLGYTTRPANPEAWLKRSAYLLSLYADRGESVRRVFRLDAPVTDIEPLLEKYEALYPTPGAGKKTVLRVAYPAIAGKRMAGVYQLTFASHARASHELDFLKSQARIMQEDLGLPDESKAAAWLLTAETFALPWIEAEVIPNRFGVGITLRIGTQDVQAEAVREAYLQILRQEIGGEHRGLSSDTIALALHEAEGRRRGQTWNDRYKTWCDRASEIGTTQYKFGSWRAYRNQVVALDGRAVWIDAMLKEAMEAGRTMAREVATPSARKADKQGGETT
jgi:hypothetical protein